MPFELLKEVYGRLKLDNFDLGWGDPHFLLNLLSSQYGFLTSGVTIPEIKLLTYSPDEGEEELLELVKLITEKLTHRQYSYYCITNGATQAINSAMRVLAKSRGVTTAVTSHFGYPYYTQMIERHPMLWRKKVDLTQYKGNTEDELYIIDSPSNPFGEQLHYGPARMWAGNNTIWDAVYHNDIYNAILRTQPGHDIYVNSFSKLLGLTGVRVGWFATNDRQLYDLMSKDSLYENATVSKVSQELVIDILNRVDLDNFMRLGRSSLNANRQVLQENLSSLLGTDVQERGMFYCAEVDDKMFDLFDRANVTYVKLNKGDTQMIRLNIGQTHDILTKAVKSVLNADRRKK